MHGALTLRRQDEGIGVGAVHVGAEIVGKEAVRRVLHGLRNCAVGHDGTAQLLARRNGRGIAGLLQPRLRQLELARIQPAADDCNQRYQCRRGEHHRIPLRVRAKTLEKPCYPAGRLTLRINKAYSFGIRLCSAVAC